MREKDRASVEKKERRHLDGVRTLQNKTLGYLAEGKQLPVDLFDNVFTPETDNYVNSVREQYHIIEESYKTVLGQTFAGELCDTTSVTSDDRLRHFKQTSQIAKNASLPLRVLNSAVYMAEVEHMLSEPEHIANSQPKETAIKDSDDLLALLEPTHGHLIDVHEHVFQDKIAPLIPKEITTSIGIALPLSRMRLGGRALHEMLDIIRTTDGAAAYGRAVAELPYGNRLHLYNEPTISIADQADAIEALLYSDTFETDSLKIASAGTPGAYRDAMRNTILAYSAMRQHDYTPREAIGGLLYNAPRTGQLTTRTLDNTPGGLWYQGNEGSLQALLSTMQYVSIREEHNKISLHYLNLPLDDGALNATRVNPKATSRDYERSQRQRTKHGPCPMRQRIEYCPPHIAHLISELQAFGIETPIIREDGSLQGGALVAVMFTLAAEQNGLFKQLENNPIFQEAIAKQPETAQDYYAG